MKIYQNLFYIATLQKACLVMKSSLYKLNISLQP